MRKREDIINSERQYARAYEETMNLLKDLALATENIMNEDIHRHDKHFWEEKAEEIIKITRTL